MDPQAAEMTLELLTWTLELLKWTLELLTGGRYTRQGAIICIPHLPQTPQ